ncbi:MAG: hypothetical protein ACM32O_20115 [Clostridia bacterium]
MHAFKRLLKTDLRSLRNTILVSAAGIMMLNFILLFVLTQFDVEFNMIELVRNLNISAFMAVLLIPFLHTYRIWDKEWKRHTILLLLSLPVTRMQVLVSKYIAILVECLIVVTIMLAGLAVQNWAVDGQMFRMEPLVTITLEKVLFAAGFLFDFTSLIFMCFFCTLLGKCFPTYSLLVTCTVFVVGMFGTFAVTLMLQSILVLYLFGGAYFLGSLYVLEKRVVVP